MTTLLVDIGNSRLKWRAVDAARGWSESDPTGAAAHGAMASLATAWHALQVTRIVACNVAGAAPWTQLQAIAAALPAAPPVNALVAAASQCGVRNSYAEPARLGADRWAALIGARHLAPDVASVIASFGTATTLDLLDATGLFCGGVILPGFELMRHSLSSGTAALPLAQGSYRSLAHDTDNAIASGIAHAQAGALERFYRLIGEAHGAASERLRVVVTGGRAAEVLPLLPFPATMVDNLVLRGLDQVARELLT